MKKLGQHFLVNKEKIKKIVEALEPKGGDTIIEIGSGHGELTGELSKIYDLRVIALEKDRRLAQELKNKLYDLRITNVEIVEGDALKVLKSYIPHLKSYKLTGNIPYYITGYLLRIIGDLPHKPERCVFTVQKEVAERMTAGPPRMNMLAASVQFWAKPEIVAFIPKKDFKPAPKVDSAIVRLKTRADTDAKQIINTDAYYKLIKIIFKQPRKTLLNNLSAAFGEKDEIKNTLSRINIRPDIRPQNLYIEEIMKIAAAYKLRSCDDLQNKKVIL